MTLRRRLYLTLDPHEKGGITERVFEFFLISIIILNILAIILDSVESINEKYEQAFDWFEKFSIAFFTIEYIARMYAIVEHPDYGNTVQERLKYAKTPLAIIDLLAFLPFYLTFLPIDLRFLRIFRLMALFRLFKIARYLHALDIFKLVLKDRKEQLVLSFIFILFVLVIVSFAMFYTEHEAQPDKFSSIPATMWWGIATLTTVGYGDIVPITTLGKFLGGVFAIAGVGLLALPAGILSSGFFEMLHKEESTTKIQDSTSKAETSKGSYEHESTVKHQSKRCPHCGKEI